MSSIRRRLMKLQFSMVFLIAVFAFGGTAHSALICKGTMAKLETLLWSHWPYSRKLQSPEYLVPEEWREEKSKVWDVGQQLNQNNLGRAVRDLKNLGYFYNLTPSNEHLEVAVFQVRQKLSSEAYETIQAKLFLQRIKRLKGIVKKIERFQDGSQELDILTNESDHSHLTKIRVSPAQFVMGRYLTS